MPPTSLLVLAGGFGTRLRTAVSAVPKALAPVADRPYLYYLIENWVEQGVTSLTFLLHYQADLIEGFLESWQSMGKTPSNCAVRTVIEPRPLGTGGAIAFAVQQLEITGSFLAANADTWLGSGIQQVSNARAPAMAVVRVENSERYGSVRVEQNTVTGFDEKQHSGGAGWINAGLYHLHAAQFQDWNCQPFSLEREMFPALANAGQLKAIPLGTEFIDIGVPEDYFRFCRWIESGKLSAL
jgi:D-glycero-alpha-D-manno-heptose 1-phosphate guanylyltransferase